MFIAILEVDVLFPNIFWNRDLELDENEAIRFDSGIFADMVPVLSFANV